MFSQAYLMCMQVAAIVLHLQKATLLPLLIIVLLAPGCLIDNVSIDGHLLIQNIGRLEVLCYSLPNFPYSFHLFNFFFFNIQISL